MMPPADQHHQEVLEDLLAVGMRFIHRADVQAERAPETLPEMAVVYDRVARSVRRTIALQHHLERANNQPERRAAARRRIIRAVEDAIDHRARSGAEAETLVAELHEHLDRPELEHEIDDRPVEDIIADICHDLGLGNIDGLYAYKRRTPADLAQLAALAAARPGHQRRSTQANEPERFFRIVPSPNDALSG
jgi:hypothetical protein